MVRVLVIWVIVGVRSESERVVGLVTIDKCGSDQRWLGMVVVLVIEGGWSDGRWQKIGDLRRKWWSMVIIVVVNDGQNGDGQYSKW